MVQTLAFLPITKGFRICSTSFWFHSAVIYSMLLQLWFVLLEWLYHSHCDFGLQGIQRNLKLDHSGNLISFFAALYIQHIACVWVSFDEVSSWPIVTLLSTVVTTTSQILTNDVLRKHHFGISCCTWCSLCTGTKTRTKAYMLSGIIWYQEN